MSGGIFLIGLGILFWQDLDFFPWILVVIGLSQLPESLANKSGWAALQGLVWLVGLAILFAADMLWPGILILIGLSIIAGAMAKPPMLQEKRKRNEDLSSLLGEKPKRDEDKLKRMQL